MDTFPPETDALFARAAAFARDVVAPRAPDWERARRVPRDAIEAAAALGLCGVETPLAHGGPGLPFTAKARLCELLAAADFAFAFSLVNTGNIANKLAREASPEVIARWVPPLLAGRAIGCTALTEPGAGSDFAAITTRATRVDGGWRLDGEKAWIANAAEADVAVVYVQTEPGSGARGVAGFVVEAARAGFVRRPAFQLAGQHAIGTGGFALDGYLATDAELLQPPGRAFKAAMASINGARTYVAAMACGMVGEALRIAQDYGESRTTFGVPLADHQGWRWTLAEASAELAAARGLVAASAECIVAGDDAQLVAAQAKLVATRSAERLLPRLAQAMGAEGLREVHPFGRHLQAARVASFVDGSSEMLLERIAAVMRAPRRPGG
jgi:alkylation response protein AidB-like acyl-CoA dehydrogenase